MEIYSEYSGILLGIFLGESKILSKSIMIKWRITIPDPAVAYLRMWGMMSMMTGGCLVPSQES